MGTIGYSWRRRLRNDRGEDGIQTLSKPVLSLFLVICFLCVLTSCGSSAQQKQPDPRLKSFQVTSEHIFMSDNQAEVDGTVHNISHDRFPVDVTISATFYDTTGNVIGQAEGVVQDVKPGASGSFILLGQLDSVRYSHMKLAATSLREHRQEQNGPPPRATVS